MYSLSSCSAEARAGEASSSASTAFCSCFISSRHGPSTCEFKYRPSQVGFDGLTYSRGDDVVMKCDTDPLDWCPVSEPLHAKPAGNCKIDISSEPVEGRGAHRGWAPRRRCAAGRAPPRTSTASAPAPAPARQPCEDWYSAHWRLLTSPDRDSRSTKLRGTVQMRIISCQRRLIRAALILSSRRHRLAHIYAQRYLAEEVHGARMAGLLVRVDEVRLHHVALQRQRRVPIPWLLLLLRLRVCVGAIA